MHLNAKKILKSLIAVVLAPIAVFLLLSVLLYLPPVQNWVAHKVADYASGQTGDSISVGRVRLSFPLDLEVADMQMLHPNDSLRNTTDTVCYVNTLVASVQLMPLFKGVVNVDELTFKHIKANTANFIGDLRIKANLKKLHIHSHGINLNGESAHFDFAEIEGGFVDIALGDTVPEDTTKEKTLWKIDIGKVSLAKTDFKLHMPGDSMTVHANFNLAVANNAQLLLHDNIYKVDALDWHGGTLDYDKNYTLHELRGFDSNHISLSAINLGIDSFAFSQPDIAFKVRAANFKERSGLTVKSLNGHFVMDAEQIRLPDIHLIMPSTDIAGKFWMDMNAFDDKSPGHFFADIKGRVSTADISPLLTSVPQDILTKMPSEPLAISGRLYGNLQYLKFRNLSLNIPSALSLRANGYAANLTSTDNLVASARLNLATRDMGFVYKFMPATLRKTIAIPAGLNVNGLFKIDESLYAADFTASLRGGTMKAKGFFNAANSTYSINAIANGFNLGSFLPTMKLGALTASISAHGTGTDIPSAKTSLALNAKIGKFRFGKYILDGINGKVRMNGGHIDALVSSHNRMVGGRIHANGTLTKNKLDVHLSGNVSHADLQQLSVVDNRWTAKATPDLTVKTDFNGYYHVKGSIKGVAIGERTRHGTINLFNGDMLVDGSLAGNSLIANIDGAIGNADLQGLGITADPYTVSATAKLSIASDLDKKYYADGTIADININTGKEQYSASGMRVNLLSDADTTHAYIDSGDFMLKADARGSYKTLLNAANSIGYEIKTQFNNKLIDQQALKARLPMASFVLKSGNDNILAILLAKSGLAFRRADIDLKSSPLTGLNGSAVIDSLAYNDDITIDSLNLALSSDNNQLKYNLALLNNSVNSYPYKGFLDGTLFEKGILANVNILDSKGKDALKLGMKAAMHDDGILTSITTPRSVIGYKEFAVNDSNYVYIGRDRRVSANMKLLADDGAGAQLYSNDEDTTSLQNITLGMHDFELGKLLAVLPLAPDISGVLNGDYHIIQTTGELTVSSDMNVKDMVYEDCPMGDVGANLVYMPMSDSTHYVDAIISQNGRDVGQLTGTYNSTGSGNLDASLLMEKFPLSFINGFVPDQIIGLRGSGEGSLNIVGPLNNLDINGEIYLDSSYLVSEPYGLEMRFANDPVTIKDSRLLFENFQMFANNDQPLNIVGYLDFHDPGNMYLDARMRAENFELVDAKENARSTIYGKAFVNFMGGMRGHLNNLRMGGRIDLLGNTDMTYVMRDTPLSTDDQTSNLVKFTNFCDSTEDIVVRPTIEGFQMDLSIGIDEQAHVVAALNEQHTNYIDLIGGGDLTLHYDPTSEMTLRGRYTLNSGQMKYSLDMIPLRTFNIQEGSYIEFNGEPTDPTLGITATESVKANYSSSGGNDRIVNFTAGVKLSNTLSKPTVEFIVKAPDDTEAQNDLNTKSAEELGKIAVTLLASGMYISNGSGGNYAMSGALASFMQNQINNVTGRALSSMGLDLTANMENSTDSRGALHTDYTFNFSKRLWNNRLRIVMGGRVSTGNDTDDGNGAYFDNFSIEYRLNKNETQYLKLYYDRQAYDWLEGNLSEFGAGFMWRRKLLHFKDIFKFKTQKQEVPRQTVGNDSLIKFKNNETK